MKRPLLFCNLLIVAISICFFSSIVSAGGGGTGVLPGENVIHPWDDQDGIVVDSLGGFAKTSSVTIGSSSDLFGNSFSLSAVSLSSRFTLWVFRSNFVMQQEGLKTNRKTINARGKLSHSN